MATKTAVVLTEAQEEYERRAIRLGHNIEWTASGGFNLSMCDRCGNSWFVNPNGNGGAYSGRLTNVVCGHDEDEQRSEQPVDPSDEVSAAERRYRKGLVASATLLGHNFGEWETHDNTFFYNVCSKCEMGVPNGYFIGYSRKSDGTFQKREECRPFRESCPITNKTDLTPSVPVSAMPDGESSDYPEFSGWLDAEVEAADFLADAMRELGHTVRLDAEGWERGWERGGVPGTIRTWCNVCNESCCVVVDVDGSIGEHDVPDDCTKTWRVTVRRKIVQDAVVEVSATSPDEATSLAYQDVVDGYVDDWEDATEPIIVVRYIVESDV